MAKPVIGISAGTLGIVEGPLKGGRRAYVNEDYVKVVAKSNGVPFIIPMTEDEEIIELQLDNIDALLLSGGDDVDPGEYGEAAQPKLKSTLPERDRFERLLIEGALKRGLPILGICRGHQILNVALGGTLYQDLEYIEHCETPHDQYENPEPEKHKVVLEKQSILHDLFGEEIEANSFHHLAIKEVAPKLRATAISSDGIVEGIEHVEHPFVIGIQWHPEVMVTAEQDKRMASLFREFILNAKKPRNRQRYLVAI